MARSVDIGNQGRLRWTPSQSLLRLGTGSRAVQTREVCEPAKMIDCLLMRFADDRDVQASADRLSDLTERHALVSDRVWTENLTLALRRPFQDERRLSNS
jgi:hypothetical protein